LSEIDKVLLLTETGRTARLFARFRTDKPVLVGTSSQATLNQLALVYGVHPHLIDLPADRIEQKESLLKMFKEKGMIKSGERVLLIHGTFWKKPGLTNSLSIVTVP
jgi:pyruvate kinase